VARTCSPDVSDATDGCIPTKLFGNIFLPTDERYICDTELTRSTQAPLSRELRLDGCDEFCRFHNATHCDYYGGGCTYYIATDDKCVVKAEDPVFEAVGWIVCPLSSD
jgi:hypothetical protein